MNEQTTIDTKKESVPEIIRDPQKPKIVTPRPFVEKKFIDFLKQWKKQTTTVTTTTKPTPPQKKTKPSVSGEISSLSLEAREDPRGMRTWK